MIKLNMNDVIDILQEECAEVIQICSKIKRFGLDSVHPRRPEEGDNLQRLTQEIGDVMGMIELLMACDEVSIPLKEIQEATIAKKRKAIKYMKITQELRNETA